MVSNGLSGSGGFRSSAATRSVNASITALIVFNCAKSAMMQTTAKARSKKRMGDMSKFA
jgi:hypothetical protein